MQNPPIKVGRTKTSCDDHKPLKHLSLVVVFYCDIYLRYGLELQLEQKFHLKLQDNPENESKCIS